MKIRIIKNNKSYSTLLDAVTKIPKQLISDKNIFMRAAALSLHLLVLSFVDDRDAGVMAHPSQLVSRGGEAHTMDPTTTTISILCHDGSKWHLLAPGCRLWLALNLLHIG